MSQLNKYLDRAKKEGKLTSDAQLARALHISKPSISLMRKGGGISGSTAVRLAKMLKIEPAEIALVSMGENDRDRTFRASCRRLLQRIEGAATIGLITLIVTLPSSPEVSAEPESRHSAVSVYYVKWVISLITTLFALLSAVLQPFIGNIHVQKKEKSYDKCPVF